MSYKGKLYNCHNSIEIIEAIKDTLVAAGWSLVGPSTDLASRQAQDDEHAHILGWFLQSNGESGQDDIPIHLSVNHTRSSKHVGPPFTFLNGAITDPDATTITVDDTSLITIGAYIKIGAESIYVGNKSGNDLINCTRGALGTTKATHSDNDVVAVLYETVSGETYPCVELWGFRDLDNAIAESSGAITHSMAQESMTGTVNGLTGYNEDRFNYTTLIRVNDPDGGGPGVPGPDHGKMRWCKNYVNSDGRVSYQKFLTAPGAVDLEVVSGGFFPCCSRNHPAGGSNYSQQLGTPYHPTSPRSTAGNPTWIYANKDGFCIVTLVGSTYGAHYFGRYEPLGDSLTTVITAGNDVSAGALTLYVDNTDLFQVGGVYRILSQNYLDWQANQDRSADTLMGATPGNWADLDPDEISSELVQVQSINEGAGTIDLDLPTIYSYKAGAVIGMNPRPVVRPTSGDGTGSNNREQFTFGTSSACWHTPWTPVPSSLYQSTSPAHRTSWRNYTNDSAPWTPLTTQGEVYLSMWMPTGGASGQFQPAAWTDILAANRERAHNRLPVVPFTFGRTHTAATELSTYGPNFNSWNCGLGTIPFIYLMPTSLGAADEDTVKSTFGGVQKDFRVFYLDNNSNWVCVGPEIWP
jgi:hypothetical protein